MLSVLITIKPFGTIFLEINRTLLDNPRVLNKAFK